MHAPHSEWCFAKSAPSSLPPPSTTIRPRPSPNALLLCVWCVCTGAAVTFALVRFLAFFPVFHVDLSACHTAMCPPCRRPHLEFLAGLCGPLSSRTHEYALCARSLAICQEYVNIIYLLNSVPVRACVRACLPACLSACHCHCRTCGLVTLMFWGGRAEKKREALSGTTEWMSECVRVSCDRKLHFLPYTTKKHIRNGTAKRTGHRGRRVASRCYVWNRVLSKKCHPFGQHVANRHTAAVVCVGVVVTETTTSTTSTISNSSM